MTFRKAKEDDLDKIEQIYSDIHTTEEAGHVTIGWNRAIYPTTATAEQALQRDDLFVGLDDNNDIVGVAIINQLQVDIYYEGNWRYPAEDSQVMVLHTLIISPKHSGKGYGTEFVKFYESYALENNCPHLRMDTNAINTSARKLYEKLGYEERGILPCTFNGIKNVNLVLLEKAL
jgi:RimJ/RimL family protein N-acetyltransferase